MRKILIIAAFLFSSVAAADCSYIYNYETGEYEWVCDNTPGNCGYDWVCNSDGCSYVWSCDK